MSGRHPSEADLALLAGGDCGAWQRFRLNRHVAGCGECQDTVASFSELRDDIHDAGVPDLDWDRFAGEMRANIHLGLAAGECVAPALPELPRRSWVPRFAVGMAGVLLLAGAGLFLRGLLPHDALPTMAQTAVLESSDTGVEVRTEKGSMKLINQGDGAGDQTVTSQGAIRVSAVDGSTGTVTVTSVYME